MIEKEFLDILACPETKKGLCLAEDDIINRINDSIGQGKIRNRGQQKVDEKIDGGLFREGDRQYLYPIRHGIPILLVDELIPTEDIS